MSGASCCLSMATIVHRELLLQGLILHKYFLFTGMKCRGKVSEFDCGHHGLAVEIDFVKAMTS